MEQQQHYEQTWVSNPSTRTSSSAWEYFGFWKKIGPNGHSYLDRSKAVCKLCMYESKYTSNTTNLSNHLRTHHRNEFSESTQSQSMLSVPSVMSPRSTQKQNYQSWLPKGLSLAIGEFVVSAMLPMGIIESDAFRQLIHLCDSKFQMPNRDYFSDILIPSMYSRTSERINVEITEADDVALSTDIWTSVHGEKLRTVSCHFIMKNWTPASYVLNTKKLPVSAIEELTATDIEHFKEEWQICRISAVVTDRDSMGNESGRFGHQTWTHITCLGHSINKAVKAALAYQDVLNVIESGRSLMSFLEENSQAISILLANQKEMSNGTTTSAFVQDTRTRWDTTLEMLERILGHSAAIRRVTEEQAVGNLNFSSLLPSSSDEQLMKGILAILRPMKEAALLLCRESGPTISMVLPTMVKLSRILQPLDCDVPPLKAVKQVMAAILRETNTSLSSKNTLNLSSFLDPRFKALPFIDIKVRREIHDLAVNLASELEPHMPNQITPDARISLPESLDAQVYLVKEEPPESPHSDEPFLPMEDASTRNSSEELLEPPQKRSKDEPSGACSLGDWFADVINPTNKSTELSSIERARQELERYLAENTLSPNANPLEWWKSRDAAYPRLAKLAKKILAIPAAKTPTDQVFSVTGALVDKRRAGLDDSNLIDMMVFLNKNRLSEVDVL